ncbi:MAG TPA: phosphatase PAP2 family protein [Chryseosolibacter sp.]|nr:phosphatase PAP2 family protein [Chryseosolibacter sp.]
MIRRLLRTLIEWIKLILKRYLRYEAEDLSYYITIVIAIFAFSLGLGLFIELTENLHENELEPHDTSIALFIQSFRSDGLTSFFRFVTDLGDRYAYIIISVLLTTFFWFRFKNWKFSVQMIMILVLASLSNVMLKQFVNRERPDVEHLVEVNTLSFPSGHSMSAMAFYGFLFYFCTRMKMNHVVRILLMSFLLIIIASIGLSRVYLGVHYPSDVAAGFMGGLIWVACSAVVFNVVQLYRRKKKGDQEPVT